MTVLFQVYFGSAREKRKRANNIDPSIQTDNTPAAFNDYRRPKSLTDHFIETIKVVIKRSFSLSLVVIGLQTNTSSTTTHALRI